MSLKIDVKSFDKRVHNILRAVPERVSRPALEKTSKKIIGEAKAITPVDTGHLRNSLKYEIKGHGAVITSVLGSDVDYAIFVHEILTNYHPNGQAKFLEKPIRRNAKTLQASVRERMRRL